jgi:S-adenosylmethionine hydrolase
MTSDAGGARVTLLTDFGTADGYAAAMKGVIAALAPTVRIDDASHDIPPGDVRAGAWALGAYWNVYPAGTIHVAVVDPGVGSHRRALALDVDGRIIIAPDNGLVTEVLRGRAPTAAVELDVSGSGVSATFHGRDLFAPAAGHMAAGVALARLGRPLRGSPILLRDAGSIAAGDSIHGTVIHIDRFGNLITDIDAARVDGGNVTIGGLTLAVARTYADVESGRSLALIGSRGRLEISVRDGSAASLLAATRGMPVVWTPMRGSSRAAGNADG